MLLVVLMMVAGMLYCYQLAYVFLRLSDRWDGYETKKEFLLDLIPAYQLYKKISELE